jgi:transcription elongation GreA/GreB family factor
MESPATIPFIADTRSGVGYQAATNEVAMTDSSTDISEITQACQEEDWERVEELWFEALDADPIPCADLLEINEKLIAAGKKNLAITLLELLADAMEAAEDHAGAMASLRELVRVTAKPPADLLARLEQVFKAARAGSPSLQAVLDRYQISAARRPAEILDKMECWLDHDQGTVVEVIGQGVGRVVDVNLELDNIKVDVGGRRPVSVPFGAAARFIRRLDNGNFLRRKVEAPEALAKEVVTDPGASLVQLLDGVGEPADVAKIKAALDGLLPADKWNTWWSKARKHPRVLTTGSGSRLRYQVSHSAESATSALIAELEKAEPRNRLTVARRLSARGEAEAEEAATFLAETLSELESNDPGLAWETAALLASMPGGARPAKSCCQRLLATVSQHQLLAGIQDRGSRLTALQALRQARPSEWQTLWGDWLPHEEHPANLSAIAKELTDNDAEGVLESALERIFRYHLEHPVQLVWACEVMIEDDAPAPLRRWMTPSLLETLPDTINRREFSPVRGRAKALFDGGQVAVRLMLEQATEQQVARFAQRVRRLSGLEPSRVSLIEQAAQQRSTAQPVEETPLMVATAAAVEAKQAELKKLLEVEIPKTLKGINAAAAEGDLRENFEYHMLRDRQELQSARAAQLQQDLAVVRILEPGAADTSRVNIGTIVHFEDLSGNEIAPLTILGPWDADIERRIFANGSDLARSLLDRRIGDEVEVGGATARITKISAWNG